MRRLGSTREWMTLAEIEHQLKLNRKGVARRLKRLEKAGLLDKAYRGGQPLWRVSERFAQMLSGGQRRV